MGTSRRSWGLPVVSKEGLVLFVGLGLRDGCPCWDIYPNSEIPLQAVPASENTAGFSQPIKAQQNGF